ncbi:DUF2255 family protein [Actinoplanes friuliensis]|jgi:hypothetical protein|uniref:DUF2255 family protein n=1 Tax=Actinoplanes friuliensis TaxID=196914 RepID=UPI0009FBDC01
MSTESPHTRAWSAAELAALDLSPLIHVAGARSDGTLRPFVQIGHVRLGQDELIRSLNGTGGTWYQGAIRTGRGEIDVDGRRIRVAFIADAGREDEVDHALRARYGNDSGVRRMMRPPAREATLRVVPLAEPATSDLKGAA